MFDYYEQIPASFWQGLPAAVILWTACVMLGRGKTARKLGIPAWKGAVPFYGAYLLYARTWKKEAFWLILAALTGRILSWYMIAGYFIDNPFAGWEVPEREISYWAMLLPDAVCTAAGLCLQFAAMKRLAAAFGKGWAFALGLVLLLPVFLLILGFGKAALPGEETEKAPEAPAQREETAAPEESHEEPAAEETDGSAGEGTAMEDWRRICAQFFEMMSRLVREQVGDTADFRRLGYQLEDAEDGVMYTLDVAPSSVNPEKPCCIQMGCMALGTDKLYSNYVFWGDKQQILDWFAGPEKIDEALNIYKGLRSRCLED